jgi:hypothetical protein
MFDDARPNKYVGEIIQNVCPPMIFLASESKYFSF